MKIVKFKIEGRFGNNLFQYFAAEIIKIIYNFGKVEYINNFQNYKDYLYIDDYKFREITNKYIIDKNNFFTDKNLIIVNGYFQRAEIFSYFRSFLKEIFNKNNDNFINQNFKISDIVNYNNYFKVKENDLILHLRLDDFIHSVKNSNILNPYKLIENIKNIKYDKLYIVCDKIRLDWELKYLENFKVLEYTLISGDILHDFKTLMYGNKLITSNSTFCWMASFLGNGDEIYICANENNLLGDQNIGCFDEKCKLIKNVGTWNDI